MSSCVCFRNPLPTKWLNVIMNQSIRNSADRQYRILNDITTSFDCLFKKKTRMSVVVGLLFNWRLRIFISERESREMVFQRFGSDAPLGTKFRRKGVGRGNRGCGWFWLIEIWSSWKFVSVGCWRPDKLKRLGPIMKGFEIGFDRLRSSFTSHGAGSFKGAEESNKGSGPLPVCATNTSDEKWTLLHLGASVVPVP